MMYRTAYSELTRMLPWVLRAQGYPYGTAEMGAHVIADAAAVQPRVLEKLAGADKRPIYGFRYHWKSSTLVVEAQQCSLLEVGPVVMYALAARHTEAMTIGSARVAGAIDDEVLPAVLMRGARHGLSSIALIQNGEQSFWYVVQNTSKEVLLYEGDCFHELLSQIERASIREAVRAALAQQGVSIIVTGTPVLPVSADMQAISIDQCINTALARGIPVDAAVYGKLYALEMETWAPTSERSRAQAGFVGG